MLISAVRQPENSGVLYIILRKRETASTKIRTESHSVLFCITNTHPWSKRTSEGSCNLTDTRSSVNEANKITAVLYTSPYEGIFFYNLLGVTMEYLCGSYCTTRIVSFVKSVTQANVWEIKRLQPVMLWETGQTSTSRLPNVKFLL